MTNPNLPDSPDKGNIYTDDEVQQMLIDRAEVMALRQLPDSLSMHIGDPVFIDNLQRGIVINNKIPRRVDNDSSYTQQILDEYSVLLATLAQQGTSFFDNPDRPGSLAAEFERLVDTFVSQPKSNREAHLNSFLLNLKEQLEFIVDPKNKKVSIGLLLTIGTEAYCRYHFAYTEDALSLLNIIAEWGTDYYKFEPEEYAKLVKAYLIISSLVDANDPYEHQIDQAQ